MFCLLKFTLWPIKMFHISPPNGSHPTATQFFLFVPWCIWNRTFHHCGKTSCRGPSAFTSDQIQYLTLAFCVPPFPYLQCSLALWLPVASARVFWCRRPSSGASHCLYESTLHLLPLTDSLHLHSSISLHLPGKSVLLCNQIMCLQILFQKSLQKCRMANAWSIEANQVTPSPHTHTQDQRTLRSSTGTELPPSNSDYPQQETT